MVENTRRAVKGQTVYERHLCRCSRDKGDQIPVGRNCKRRGDSHVRKELR